MAKSRQSLQDNEDTLMREEEVVKADLKAADELISDAMNATSKLHAWCPFSNSCQQTNC